QEINDNEEIDVHGLEFTGKDMVEAVKTRRADKRYRATVALDDPVSEEDLERLADLVGTVEQATPTRVEHRRADRTREREVYDVDWERVDDTTIELEVAAAAGTYIKELISGDEDKTEPSVAQLLGTGAECEQLDVIAIGDDAR
ncbi:MAG: tRNA pseudouridine(54/55) synthase Pus10, partial [Candidatus Nanohaloarchaea archaeon]|nr:tRNA pseudouridine(54/55) synthase Pus10 [Candidatus Nanohaloarchaea archaeon]